MKRQPPEVCMAIRLTGAGFDAEVQVARRIRRGREESYAVTESVFVPPSAVPLPYPREGLDDE